MALLQMGEYRGVVLIAVAYFCVYYALMFLQIHSKTSARNDFQQGE